MHNLPNYKNIYLDIITQKFPKKKEELSSFLDKKNLCAIDIIELDKKIFGAEKLNQKHRSYRKSDILKILEYQKENHLNNKQLAHHFKLSRNTIAKWKKMFLV